MTLYTGAWDGDWNGSWEGGGDASPTFANMGMLATGSGSMAATAAQVGETPLPQYVGGWFERRPKRKALQQQEPQTADMTMLVAGRSSLRGSLAFVSRLDEWKASERIKLQNTVTRAIARRQEEEAMLVLM